MVWVYVIVSESVVGRNQAKLAGPRLNGCCAACCFTELATTDEEEVLTPGWYMQVVAEYTPPSPSARVE